MRICTYPDCGRPLQSKGLCQTHYWQKRRGEELRPIKFQTTKERQLCAFVGCGRFVHAKGLCIPHRKQQLRGHELEPIRGASGGVCTVEGCGRKVASKGLCQTHAKYRNEGKELKPILPPTYRYLDYNGYIRLKEPGHLNAAKNGIVLEHVKVMAEMLGRPLVAGENVHHRNGQRDDNRRENLELWSTRQPKGQRVADKIAWCIEFLALYGYEAIEARL